MLEDAYIGCSIAVNGVCLTVVAMQAEEGQKGSGNFSVNLAPETLRKTNLCDLRVGDGVNLERAMLEGGRNSGHAVQGHVDDTGIVFSKERDGDSLKVVIQAPCNLMRYIVPKGYIAVDGTSLTVIDVDRKEQRFSFMLIPHTQGAVVIPQRNVGHRVNIEVDVLAKYTETQHKSRSHNHAEICQDTTTNHNTHVADTEMVAISQHVRTVHGVGMQVPMEPREGMRYAIIKTCWHSELIQKMRDKCFQKLIDICGKTTKIDEVEVPGSFELPMAASSLIRSEVYDAVICIGILLKGGTIHMEVIANTVSPALMKLQLQSGTPIIFGVLTTLSIEQAKERAESNLPESWAEAAVCMAKYKLPKSRCEE